MRNVHLTVLVAMTLVPTVAFAGSKGGGPVPKSAPHVSAPAPRIGAGVTGHPASGFLPRAGPAGGFNVGGAAGFHPGTVGGLNAGAMGGQAHGFNTGAGGQARGFGGGGAPGGQARGFGGSGAPGEQARGFGGGGAPGAQARGFGVTPGGEPAPRGFGGMATNSERGFGPGPGGAGRAFGPAEGEARGFGPHVGGGPRFGEHGAAGHSFMYHGHSFARFHGGPYRWPHGYGYRPYEIGAVLPAVFLVSTYFVTDYADYGLDQPPDGYQWVHYGPDLLQVNEATGEISQNIQGAFDDGEQTANGE